MTRVSVRARCTGRVQGVSFRAIITANATARGLMGWVTTLEDGSVEVHIEGREAEVEGLLGWLQKGPPMAQVRGLTWFKVASECATHFEVRR